MQTFLPYPNFAKTAHLLDYRRLGKQRVEAWQILNTLKGKSKGWQNHPAVKMWQGYEPALAFYGLVMCLEWKRRGYRDSLAQKFLNEKPDTAKLPAWFGDPAFHKSHRSNLKRKDPQHYQFNVPANLPYIWPV